MLIYLIVFLISFISSILAAKFRDNKKLFYLFSFLAIAIPSLLAAFRDTGIGTDTKIYINKTYLYIENNVNNLIDLFKYMNSTSIEPLYILFNYFISLISNNLNVLYFALEFLILYFFYFGCVKFSKKINISFALPYLIYLLLFYNKSFNMCRQMMSMSICFYATTLLFENKKKSFILFLLFAYGFHRSIIVFVPIFFIYNLITNKNKQNTLLLIIILLLSFSIIIFYKDIIIFLVKFGILNSKYLNYVDKYGNSSNLTMLEILSHLLMLIASIFFSKKLIKISSNNSFLIYMVILAFATLLLGLNASYIQRTSYYFSMFFVYIIPQFSKIIKYNGKGLLTTLIILSMLVVHYYFYYDVYNIDETIPYRININKS